VVPGSAYGQARPDVAVSLPATGDRLIGPLTADLADPTTGFVTITRSAITGLTSAVIAVGGA
jgi:hypothetical protein